MNATYTVAELLRCGVTTFVELRAQVAVQDALLEQVKRFGSGPIFRQDTIPVTGSATKRAGSKEFTMNNAGFPVSRLPMTGLRGTTAP